MENGLQQLLPDHIAQAICRTLLHSLWQGLILAVLTGLVIVLTKTLRPAARYRLLVGLLSLFTLSFVGTLILEFNSQAGSTAIIGKPGSSITLSDILNDVLLYLQQHAGLIVVLWLLVICLRSVRLLFGLYAMERLRKKKVSLVGSWWEDKVSQLALSLGIRRTISLLESGIAKVPVVIGYLKPAILIPIGLINALGPTEVEAILLHELAHIRRRDYLVNLLQSFAETLFFFNPAILWLSTLIRTERENCCDDLVISHTQNKIGYIKALVHYQEHQLGMPAHALAFSGQHGGMVHRLERIVAGHNRTLNKLEMIGLAALLLISAFLIAVKPAGGFKQAVKTEKKTPVPVTKELLRSRQRELELYYKTHPEAVARKRAMEVERRKQQTDSIP